MRIKKNQKIWIGKLDIKINGYYRSDILVQYVYEFFIFKTQKVFAFQHYDVHAISTESSFLFPFSFTIRTNSQIAVP